MIPSGFTGLLADNGIYGIGAAIVIAIGGFAYTVYNGVRTDRRTETYHELDELYRRLERAETDLKECSAARDRLEKRIVRLLMDRNGDT